jgi:hypothetical protein
VSKPNRSHINYCIQRLEGHSDVRTCRELPDPTECLLEIVRKDNSKVIAHLTAAYEYTLGEYFSRPARTNFIVLLPHGKQVGSDVVAEARKDRIGIGLIGKLMGFLNRRSIV